MSELLKSLYSSIAAADKIPGGADCGMEERYIFFIAGMQFAAALLREYEDNFHAANFIDRTVRDVDNEILHGAR